MTKDPLYQLTRPVLKRLLRECQATLTGERSEAKELIAFWKARAEKAEAGLAAANQLLAWQTNDVFPKLEARIAELEAEAKKWDEDAQEWAEAMAREKARVAELEKEIAWFKSGPEVVNSSESKKPQK